MARIDIQTYFITKQIVFKQMQNKVGNSTSHYTTEIASQKEIGGDDESSQGLGGFVYWVKIAGSLGIVLCKD